MNTDKLFDINTNPLPNSKVINLFFRNENGDLVSDYGFFDPLAGDPKDFSMYEYDQFGNKKFIGMVESWSFLTSDQEAMCSYYEFLPIVDEFTYAEFKSLYDCIHHEFNDNVYYYFDAGIAIKGNNLLKSLLSYEIFTLKEVKTFVVNKFEDASDCEDCGYSFSTIFTLSEKLKSGDLREINTYGKPATCFGGQNGYSVQVLDYLLTLYKRRPIEHDELFNFSDEECFQWLSQLLNIKIEYEEIQEGIDADD